MFPANTATRNAALLMHPLLWRQPREDLLDEGVATVGLTEARIRAHQLDSRAGVECNSRVQQQGLWILASCGKHRC